MQFRKNIESKMCVYNHSANNSVIRLEHVPAGFGGRGLLVTW